MNEFREYTHRLHQSLVGVVVAFAGSPSHDLILFVSATSLALSCFVISLFRADFVHLPVVIKLPPEVMVCVLLS